MDEVEDEVEALGEEADGAARQLRLHRRFLSPRWSIQGMTLASSLSGCAGRLVVASGFQLRLRARWKWSRPRR